MREFLLRNTEFWKKQPLPTVAPSGRYILVDFLAENPAYLMINAVLAKALQARTGHELVAVTLDNASTRWLRALAFSYGIKHVFSRYEPVFDHDPDHRARIHAALQSCPSPEQLRRAVLGLEVDGLRIGDLVYDTFVREGNVPTVSADELERLARGIELAIYEQRFLEWLCERFDVAASVQGHVVYTGYGLMARTVVRRGGEVFSRNGTVPNLMVRRYRDPARIDEFERCTPPALLDWLESLQGERIVLEAREAFERRLQGREPQLETISDAYRDDRRVYGRRELLEPLGLDPAKPVVFIMNQVYSDGPHTYQGMLFDDYACYLNETCEVAASLPQVNWIIRDHPSNPHYNPDHSATTVASHWLGRARNLAVCPPDLAPRNMHELAEAATALGEMSLELACMGVPCIVPGRTIVAGHGLCHEPRSKAEYFGLLRRAPSLPRPDAEQVRRAYRVLYTLLCTRHESGLIPRHSRLWFREASTEELFERAAALFEQADVRSDPLYQNFLYMLDHDLDYLLPFDRLGLR